MTQAKPQRYSDLTRVLLAMPLGGTALIPGLTASCVAGRFKTASKRGMRFRCRTTNQGLRVERIQ